MHSSLTSKSCTCSCCLLPNCVNHNSAFGFHFGFLFFRACLLLHLPLCSISLAFTVLKHLSFSISINYNITNILSNIVQHSFISLSLAVKLNQDVGTGRDRQQSFSEPTVTIGVLSTSKWNMSSTTRYIVYKLLCILFSLNKNLQYINPPPGTKVPKSAAVQPKNQTEFASLAST